RLSRASRTAGQANRPRAGCQTSPACYPRIAPAGRGKISRMAQQLTGTIERVTFHNPETGYAVLRVLARGRRGVVTVVGKIPSVAAGEQIDATGEWVYDPAHGEQFKADTILCRPPSSVEGIEKYLASGLVKGVGPKYARKIVEVFGERT